MNARVDACSHLADEEFNDHDVAVARLHVVKEFRAADAVCDVGRGLIGIGQVVCGQVWVAPSGWDQCVLHVELQYAMKLSIHRQSVSLAVHLGSLRPLCEALLG